MIEISIEELYEIACAKVGELTVTNAVLQAELARLSAERDALAARAAAAAGTPAGTLDEPLSCPPFGQAMVQNV